MAIAVMKASTVLKMSVLSLVLLHVLLLGANGVLYSNILELDEIRHAVVVAVSALANGSYVGVSADLYVRVSCPGNGHVYVETLPLSELDLQASTRIAAIVASLLAGVDFRKCDFYASINADAPIIGGPSASGVVAIAFAAALLRLPLNNSIVMTGMIMPDGSIGPVGGIKYKLEAAAARGAKVFLVPYGQTIDYVYRVITEQVGIISVRRTIIEPIDIISYGESLGVKVVQVSNVHEALEIFANGMYKVALDTTRIASHIRETYDNIKPLLQSWIEDMVSEINLTIAMCNKIEKEVLDSVKYRHGQRAHNYVVAVLNGINEDIKESISKAEDAVSRNNLYLAASMYFRALIHAYTKMYILNIANNSEFAHRRISSIKEVADELARRVHDVVKRGVSPIGISVAINVLDRVYEALMYANKSANTKDLIQIANNLAYAEARLYTARLWSTLLNLSTSTNVVEGRLVHLKDVENMALYIETLVRNLYAYMVSLSNSVQLSQEAEEALQVYRVAQAVRNPLDKLALCISFISYAYLALVNTFSRSSEALIYTLNRTMYINFGLLGDVIPVDVVLYLELVENSNDGQQVIALTKLSMLLAVYRMLNLVAGSGRPNIGMQPDVGQAQNVRPTTIATTITITITIVKGAENSVGYDHAYLLFLLLMPLIFALIAILLIINKVHSKRELQQQQIPLSSYDASSS